MHKVADAICAAISVPFLNLADCTAARIVGAGIGRVALLGTRFTMEEDFYKARLRAHGLAALVPAEEDMAEIHRVIYDELYQGVVRDSRGALPSSSFRRRRRRDSRLHGDHDADRAGRRVRSDLRHHRHPCRCGGALCDRRRDGRHAWPRRRGSAQPSQLTVPASHFALSFAALRISSSSADTGRPSGLALQ